MGQELGFELRQGQNQTLNLSQGMRQSILILQLDAIDLTAYLQEVSLSNPLIDIRTHLDTAGVGENAPVGNYQLKDSYQSLFEYLIEQVQLTMRKTPLRALVIYLIEQLDPRGYLKMSDAEIRAEVGVDEITLLDAKTLLHQLDPPGVGANSLQECLYLQAELDADQVPEGVLDLLAQHFDDLVAHRWSPLCANLGLTPSQLDACRRYIQTLTPDPGLPYNHTQTGYLIPELRLVMKNGQATLKINRRGQPELVFATETYTQLCQSTDAEVRQYIREKRDQYQSLAYALQRRQATLMMIGRELVRRQFTFFQEPTTPLAPLLLRDVAQYLQLSESTVSRAINGKYIQVGAAIYPLKMFFSRYSAGTDGQAHSTSQLIAALKTAEAQEDKTHPLSDAALVKVLATHGFQIARRTVAKYRQEARIPVAKERRLNSDKSDLKNKSYKH